MATTKASPGKATGGDSPARDLRLEEEECVTASPTSPRFSDSYRQFRPQSIDEVRELIGISAEVSAVVAREHQDCCHVPSALASRLVTPDDLEAEDDQTRHSARTLAYIAGRAYVSGISTVGLEQWKPVLDKYVDIGHAVIHILFLEDIDIADRATLTLSSNTHALYANRITIHGSGRIVCRGHAAIRARSVEGIKLLQIAPSAGLTSAVATTSLAKDS